MAEKLYCIHVREDNKTMLYFSDEHYRFSGEAPLAYRPIEVYMYHGYNFLGILRAGYVWCSAWRYKVKFEKLIVVCQIED